MQFSHCYGCMRELPAPGIVCPNCGFDNTNGPARQERHILPCGTILSGKYVIGKMLGQGGFGVTYIGLDTILETPVCIKEYFPSGAAMRDSTRSTEVTWSFGKGTAELRQGQDSFLKEARKAFKLRDLPSVVMVWDIFQENGTTYIVMDYIEGMTLKNHLIKRGKPLSESECIELFSPVMLDLDEVHRRGIIHRDISPDNLMMRSDGSLVLLDLGAAKDLSRGSGQSSFVVAKKGFSPMEQYSYNSEIGPWTDVYAICATIVWCCTGKLLPEPLDRMVGQDGLDLSEFSPAVAAVLEKGLSIEPKFRFQTMGELLTALIEPNGWIKLTPEAKPEPTPEPTPKAAKRRLPLILSATALVLAVTVFALVHGDRESGLAHESTPILLTESAPEPKTEPTSESTVEPILEPKEEPLLTSEVSYRDDDSVSPSLDKYQRGDYAQTVALLRREADEGRKDGLYALGTLYEDGLGTEADLYTAIELYIAGAEAGDMQAKEKLKQPQYAHYAKIVSEQDSYCYLPGSWEEIVPLKRGFGSAYRLSDEAVDCGAVRMCLTVREFEGYPYGTWYLYAQDLSGNWEHAARFDFGKELNDGKPVVFDLTLDAKQDIQALAICTAEDGMEYTVRTWIEFYVDPACLPACARRFLPPDEEQIAEMMLPEFSAKPVYNAPSKSENDVVGGDSGGGGNSGSGGSVVKLDKPIIYLYPAQETDYTVVLGRPERLSTVYPAYTDRWSVHALTDGTLTDLSTGRELYALYWEGKDGDYAMTDEGFLVRGDEAAAFFEEKLEILGLSAREAEEFIVYWLPKMQSCPYNYIRFASPREIERNMPLKITPQPDSVIRVMMVWKAMDDPVTLREQTLVTPTRKGSVAVEWGGVILD